MYNLTDIRAIHLEVTSRCQAKCPMCARRMNGGPLNPFMGLDEIGIDKFMEWFDVDFIKQLNHLGMCGNLGDPIVAKDTLQIYEYLRESNLHMGLQMHTNGSGRTDKWWKELAKLKVNVVFGIDGLADTHAKYRINTDWKKIIHNVMTFVDAGGKARWDMLVFEHNQHQIDECRELSKRLGMENFSVKHTTRFKDGKFVVLNEQGQQIDTLYPSQKSKEMTSKVKQASAETLPTINCKAVKDSMLYVSALGTVTPCCWLDQQFYPPSHENRIDYLNKIKIWPNLNDTSLKSIFASGYFDLIAGCWNSTGLKECSKQCGSFDKLNEQFVERS
jgi:MoaA/NifB/PqqE/SkfB family radical SAM enzyme